MINWGEPTSLGLNLTSRTLKGVALGVTPYAFVYSTVLGHIERLRLELLLAGWLLLKGGLSESLPILAHAFHAYSGRKSALDAPTSVRSRRKKEF